MTRRKKTRVYRFSGPIAQLEERIARCRFKIADESDPDDKRWLARWLKAAEIRLAQKEQSVDAKNRGKRNRRMDEHKQSEV